MLVICVRFKIGFSDESRFIRFVDDDNNPVGVLQLYKYSTH